MSVNAFDSFINNVYSGGNAIEFFDSDFGIVGGADDISVDSIFGGCECKQDEPKDGGVVEQDSSQQDDCQTNGGGIEDFLTEYKPIEDDLIEQYTAPVEDIKKKKVEFKGGVSATEVADLISIYT